MIELTATSTDTAYNNLDPDDVSVTNEDDDTAGITVDPTSGLTTTESGGTAMFTVVLDSQPTADVNIGVSSSDTGEGTVSTDMLTFTTTTWNNAQTVTVTGVDDGAADGAPGIHDRTDGDQHGYCLQQLRPGRRLSDQRG